MPKTPAKHAAAVHKAMTKDGRPAHVAAAVAKKVASGHKR